ncbi:hypothetical protein [Aquimarina sp. 2201CG14-23]|uniref:hypothetical protein n=1 Tax=Aquimarina mycalae TaxID=3040073 RepID=UPI002477E223|nr:hypothetical protein [Aquimarina sp. 2201CG14-23]MDH7445837.1 hypothetical protein [Aquimarina sp. 2201CG14-23]
MEQGFEAWEYKENNNVARGAQHKLSTPPVLIESEKLTQSPTGTGIEIPLQGVTYKIKGDLEEVLDYLAEKKDVKFVSGADHMGEKMNVSVKIADGKKSPLINEKEFIKKQLTDIILKARLPLTQKTISQIQDQMNPEAGKILEKIANSPEIKKVFGTKEKPEVMGLEQKYPKLDVLKNVASTVSELLNKDSGKSNNLDPAEAKKAAQQKQLESRKNSVARKEKIKEVGDKVLGVLKPIEGKPLVGKIASKAKDTLSDVTKTPVVVTLGVVPGAFKKEDEVLAFDTGKKALTFGELAQSIKERYLGESKTNNQSQDQDTQIASAVKTEAISLATGSVDKKGEVTLDKPLVAAKTIIKGKMDTSGKVTLEAFKNPKNSLNPSGNNTASTSVKDKEVKTSKTKNKGIKV